MKREAWGHRKYRKLSQILEIDECYAVGIVESLWRASDQELPAGNIGKLSNADIALAMRYGGDPDRLVAGLTEAGWIDPHPDHRLIIHDWPDHCEHVIHNRIARAHHWFANGQAPRLERLEKRYREECQQFYCDNLRPSAPTSTDYAPINSCPALPCPAFTTTEQAALRKTTPVVDPPPFAPPPSPSKPQNGNGNGKQPNPPEAVIEHVRKDLLLYPPAARLRGQPDNQIVCECIWAVHGDLELLSGILATMNRDGKKPEKSWAYFPTVIKGEVEKLCARPS